MILEKNKKAKVIALNIEERESIDYHNDLVSAMATVEKSRSMYFQTKIYHVVFSLDNNKTKEFVVDKKTYDELSEGKEYTINYFADKLISFAA